MQKEIAFRELLDSTILAEYNEVNDVYTLVVNWSNWSWSWNEYFIWYSWMINFFENMNNYFSIFFSYNTQNKKSNELENKIKNNLHIKEIYLNITSNELISNIKIRDTEWNDIWEITAWFIWVLKIDNLNLIYDLDDIIFFETSIWTWWWMCWVNQIMFKI